MQYVTDLHLHSKYSRAVSQDMVLSTMAKVAAQKGIDILTASDWTHPLWFKEIQNQLEEAGEGIYKIKNQSASWRTNIKDTNNGKETLFILSTEISSIYSQGGRLRRIHNLVFAPNFEVADKINKEMLRRGYNLLADGRPIIGASSKNLLELIKSIDERCFLIPCHVWTPHFGIYGSASGFDSLEEAFEELASEVIGIETGLSSDPEMNWQIEELDTRSILSFSDAHSPAKMGREATVVELEEVSYEDLREAFSWRSLSGYGNETRIERRLRNPLPTNETGPLSEPSIVTDKRSTKNRILYTMEFYPEEGKYHFSGHRNCKVVFGPEEIREKGSVCPVCRKRLTEGVLFRVQQLSQRDVNGIVEAKTNQYGLKWYTDTRKLHPPYVKLVPLLEIIAEAESSTAMSQKVKAKYHALVTACGDEFRVLLKTPIDMIAKEAGEKIAQGIQKVREGTISIDPGYDGEYGKVKIWSEEEEKGKEALSPQLSLEF